MKHLVLLETRLSKNVPNYDFRKMAKDEKILEFEKIAEEKLKLKEEKE